MPNIDDYLEQAIDGFIFKNANSAQTGMNTKVYPISKGKTLEYVQSVGSWTVFFANSNDRRRN